jgi:hypothetical protein
MKFFTTPIRWLMAVCFTVMAAVGTAAFLSASGPLDPVIRVEYQGDSALFIARWNRPCDSRGCAESYVTRWAVGDVARPQRTRTIAIDSLWTARPAPGRSLTVNLSLQSIRRGLLSSTRTASRTISTADAPPPPVDSLVIDTLAAQAAELDSFPTIAIRDTLGRREATLRVGESTVLCALSRNRYTGVVYILVPADAPASADAYLDTVCERARQSFAGERSG